MNWLLNFSRLYPLALLSWACLLSPGSLLATKPLPLAFHCFETHQQSPEDLLKLSQDLAPFDNARVKISGFLYEAADRRWILAKEPHLRTCCIGTEKTVTQQIFLPRDFSAPPQLHNKLVNIEGQFHIAPLANAEGKLVQLFYMSDVASASTRVHNLPLFSLSILTLLGISFTGMFYYKKRKR